MKRILFFLAITGLLLATSGCSNGPLQGVMSGNTSSGLFSGSVLPSNFLKDGPVRQWLRGDACDSCNMPAGQITYDSGFDSSCQSCGDVSSPVMSSPVMSAPATNYYPSYNESAPQYGESLPQYGESLPQYGESLPQLPLSGPLDGGSGMGGINESQFFGGASDNIELPPLSGY